MTYSNEVTKRVHSKTFSAILLGKKVRKMTDFNEVGFSNNFMFGKIMEKPERAKAFLEQILGFDIDHVEYLEREKQVDERYDGRSIRMDIYASDGKNVYDCEMQTTNTRNLPKRSRYYQSMIDIGLLKRNDNFRALKKSFVIFICTFDPFDKNQCIYTFENKCNEVEDLLLNDESIKIFVNTKGTEGDVTDEFKDLLRFIDTSEDRVYSNSLANELLAALKLVKNNEEWRHEYMTLSQYGNDCRNEGREVERIESIQKMLHDGKTPKEISEFCGYDLSFVKEVQEKMLIEA